MSTAWRQWQLKPGRLSNQARPQNVAAPYCSYRFDRPDPSDWPDRSAPLATLSKRRVKSWRRHLAFLVVHSVSLSQCLKVRHLTANAAKSISHRNE